MSEIFSIKRFARYLLFDIRNALDNYGLSFVILCFTPLIVFLFYNMISLLFNREWGYYGAIGDLLQILSFYIAGISMAITAGPRIYGRITEKSAGSGFLLLPASTAEKAVSMIFTLGVVIPFIFFLTALGSDFVLTSVLGDRYFASSPIVSKLFSGPDSAYEVCRGICTTVLQTLVFGLGAICFKKSKITKTVLCELAAMIVIGSIYKLTLFFPESAAGIVSGNAVLCLLVIAGIFVRIRRLKF